MIKYLMVELFLIFFLSANCNKNISYNGKGNDLDSILITYLSSQIKSLDSFKVEKEINLKKYSSQDYFKEIKLLNTNFNILDFNYIDSIKTITIHLKHRSDSFQYTFSILQLYFSDPKRREKIFNAIKNDSIDNTFRFYHHTIYNNNKSNTRYEPQIFANSIILFEYGLYVEKPEAKRIMFNFLKTLE